MPLQDPVDSGRRDKGLVVALQEEADPEGSVLTLLADLEDEGGDVREHSERIVARPSRAVAKTNKASLRIPLTSAAEERP